MSFRLRVLVLVMLVAVTATGATAWLTVQQASAQITESVTADREQVELVSRELRDYGYRRGTWEGVVATVRDLGRRTGQRLQLVTESGQVIVDTDTESRRAARPTNSLPTFIDPRPTLTLPSDLRAPDRLTRQKIAEYRQGVLLAACLTRNGFDVQVTHDAHGVPTFAPDPATRPVPPDQLARCRSAAAADARRDTTPERAEIGDCLAGAAREPATTCLQRVFRRQIGVGKVAPVPLLLYLGARDLPPSPLASGPALAAAAGVAVLAVAGTALLSRRVLRPIATLTVASRRLGQGDLTGRVPVLGNDELAELARSFNRMADSLQRGEERQRRLVADVAHELRTPLANLRGYLEALQDGVIEPDAELFASLHEEAVLQQRIVDDLQDLALAEAGALAYHRVPVDLADLLEACRAAHHAVAEAAGVAVTVEVAGPVPVVADPDRLRQVLGNLITNAVRATSDGGTVTLRAAVAGASAVVEVADTGTGIAAAALPYVFDRFWRADPARGRRTGGSGLGLAIVRQIVTDHGGAVAVRSQVGVGTAFALTLPASPVHG